MLIPIKLRITKKPEDLQELVSAITVGGQPLKVLSVLEEQVTIAITLSTPPVLVIDEIKKALSNSDVSVWEEPPLKVTVAEIASMKLDPVDVVNVVTRAMSVWDVIFKKPPPVFDRNHWAELEVSDKFIYIPNCTRFKGPSAEDYNSNAMYTQIMLAAYQNVCRARGVNPLVRLQNGRELPMLTLQAFHGSQTHLEGERAAGLANSVLVDFCDEDMGSDFIAAVSLLEEDDFQSEPARQTVLAKSELILAGKSSHMYNQRFIKEFYQLVSVNYAQDLGEIFGANEVQAQSATLNIFRGMVIDGFVLEDSLEEFKARLWASGLGQYEGFLGNIYSEVNCG